MSTMAEDDPIPIDDQSLFFRQIVDSFPELLHTARPDGYLDFFNQTWLDFTGVPLEKLLGWGWTCRIHPDDVEAFVQKMRESFGKGKPFQETSRMRRADGVHRWMLHRQVPRFDGDGKLIKWHGSSIDIDDLKRAEEQLIKSAQESQRSEAYLAEAQRLSRTGSFGWKPGCEEHVWSDETYRIFEYSPRDKVTLDMIVERVHPEDRNFVLETVERASISGGAINYEYRLLFPDDRVKNVHVLARPLEINSDDLEFAGAVIDITEAKRAEEKIRRSEKELQVLVEAIPAYVGTNLPDGSLDFISQSWLDYTGLSREQWMGWGWVSTIHPEDVDRVVANWQAALAASAPVEYQLRCRGADGIYHWFLYRGVPFCDYGGKVVKWYGTVTNIDVLKETEHALQTREQQLLGVIETIPSLLWSASPAFVPTHMSKRLLEYFGAPFEEFVNGGWESFIHPDDLEDTGKAILRAVEAGESFRVMHRLRRADGEYRWHHAGGEPLRDPEGKIIQWYGLSIDIDDRKRAEDHLRDTRIKLAKASRLATVAELAGSIAHELNQPLMSILANAQAAKRWLNGARSNVTEANSSIERTIRDARAADERMQHIRALFKQESFDKKDVKIADILNEVVRIVQEDPKKRAVPVECHFEESLPAVLVDQIQIQQVFINLIVNAIEALEGQQGPRLVTLRAAVTGSDRMLIQVIDNGPGFYDPERIFDAFMTTKEKGMGIGLAVSRSIVEAHGGRLWAENNKAGGAIFNVALPLSHASLTTA
jgi:PAS domain S-box-containing protein